MKNPIGVLRAAAFVAWSDARISDIERAAYEKLVDSLDLTDDVRTRARDLIKHAPVLEDIAADIPDKGDRTLAITFALRIAHADDRYSVVEDEKVRRLALALGIDDAALDALEAKESKML
jgi:tellurite resistance protein